MIVEKATSPRFQLRLLVVLLGVQLSQCWFMSPITQAKAARTTYYVSNCGTIGNDSNDGRTTSKPWLTINKINTSVFNPGDSILFNRGCTWREQLVIPSSGSAGNPITFGAYGSGAAPILTGSNAIHLHGLAKERNIWKSALATQPHVVAIGSVVPHSMSVSEASVSAPGDWYWSDGALWIYGAGTLSGLDIEVGARAFGVIRTNDRSYITVDGLTIKGGNGQGVNVGSVSVTGIAFKNCVVENNATEGFNIVGSTTAHDVTIDHCIIRNNGWWGIAVGKQYTSTSQISNNLLMSNGWNSVADSQEYSQIDGSLGNFNVFGNTVTATTPNGCKQFAKYGNYCHAIYYSAGFGEDRTTVANIYENRTYGNAYGDGIKSTGSANIHHNVSYGNAGGGILVGQNAGTNVVLNIWGNVVHDNDKSNEDGGIVEQAMGSGTIRLNVYNNTLFNNANTAQVELKVDDNILALNIQNNILYASPTRSAIGLTVPQIGVGTIDHNIYWRADGNPQIRYKRKILTWAQWQVLGYDSHGLVADPRLANPSSGNLCLQAGSPAIDAGAKLGSTYHFGLDPKSSWPDSVVLDNQNSYGSGWEIGAYVYASNPVPTTISLSPASRVAH